MAIFFFHLEDGKPFEDVDGVELSVMSDVRREAAGFARDVMRMKSRRDWSHWGVRVTDESGELVLALPFLEVE